MPKTFQSFVILNQYFVLLRHIDPLVLTILLIHYFTQCIQEGVRYLMRMLQVRNSVKLNDGVVLHDTATGNVLSEGKYVITSSCEYCLCPDDSIKLISRPWFPSGIFSDTHLLTMMYIGEMCFWAVKYEDCSTDSTERKEDSLQFRDIGTQILNKYVLACEGPLQGQGWNTENAKEILSILQ